MDYIYDGELRDTRDFASDEPLFVNHCGFSYNKNLAVIREKGRHDFHIIYVISGECKVEIDGKSETMRENGFAIYFPDKDSIIRIKNAKDTGYIFRECMPKVCLKNTALKLKYIRAEKIPK